MRTIQPTKEYRRDYRRAKANPHYKNLDDFLAPVLEMLANDKPLPERNRDHDLSGNWADCRECHVRPDLLLIYMKRDASELRLVRLGSHSDLFR